MKPIFCVKPVVLGLWLICAVMSQLSLQAQKEPPDAENLSPYRDIADANLRAAFTRLEGLQTTRLDSSPSRTAELAAADLYRRPENFAAIMTVLQKVDSGNLDVHKSVAIEQMVKGTISAAIMSGKTDAIPVLKKLAWNSDDLIRKAVSTPNAYSMSELRPVELLLEVVKSAESRLPDQLLSDQHTQDALNEFEDRVILFCDFTTPTDRKSIQPLLDHFSQRYNDAKLWEYYKNRFAQLMDDDYPPKIRTQSKEDLRPKDRGKQIKHLPATALPPTEGNKHTWLVWLLVVITSAIGAAWLLMRKSKP